MKKHTSKIIGAVIVIIVIVGIVQLAPETGSGELDWSNERQVFALSLPADTSEAKRERYEKKLADSKELYRTAFDDSWTYTVLGDLYSFVPDYDKAIQAYERVLELEPGNIGARLNLATIYAKYSDPIDYDKAEFYYRENVAVDANNVGTYLPLAELLWRKKGDIAGAQDVYDLALLNVGEDDADVLLAMIDFYKEQGDDVRMKETAQTLLSFHGNNELFQQQFGALVK